MGDPRRRKVLAAAREVFLRYGYKRVSMNEIAAATGVSRPAIYVLFKNKEEIFTGVFLDWVDATIAEIEQGMMAVSTPTQKLECAFDIWAVRPFVLTNQSPEAKELIECTFGFAQDVQRQGYARFEATITPVLAGLSETPPLAAGLEPKTIAHVLASAVRGFKQTAETPDDLRRLIQALLALLLDPR